MRRVVLLTAATTMMSLAVTTCQAQPHVFIKHKGYDVIYNVDTKVPDGVCWLLVHDDYAGRSQLKSRHFKIDASLPPPRVKDSDYRASGYVRGHMCPAGDRDSRKDLEKETYFLSNICPMTMVANSGGWKLTEDTCRMMASHGCELKITAGTLFLARDTVRIGRHQVAVPHAFWKYAECMIHPGEHKVWFVENNHMGIRCLAITKEELLLLLSDKPEFISFLRYRYQVNL